MRNRLRTLRRTLKGLRAAFHIQVERAGHLADRIGFEVERVYLKRVRRQPIRLAIEVDRTGVGLFAELNMVVYLILYAHSIGAAPGVTIRSGLYRDPESDHPDWLGHLFDTGWRDPESEASHATIRRTIRHVNQLPRFQSRVGRVSLWEANAVVRDHLQPRPHIVEAVERFIAEHLSGGFLAIHWRGTDKVSEAPAVTLQEVMDKTQAVIACMRETPRAIFVASDDQHLIDRLRAACAATWPGLRLVTRADAIRSLDGQPIHLRDSVSPQERQRMGEDAVIDCLLLSRAAALVRTASFLSGWASVFSPNMPVYLLNKPYTHCTWFPDREVINLSDHCHRALNPQRKTAA